MILKMYTALNSGIKMPPAQMKGRRLSYGLKLYALIFSTALR